MTDVNQQPDVSGLTPARRWPPPLDPSQRLDTPLATRPQPNIAPGAMGASDAPDATDETDAADAVDAQLVDAELVDAPDGMGAPDVIDLTADEPVEHKPSLDGPRTKLAWAESHLQLFQDEWQKLVDAHAYTFIHEVHADGLNHRYRAVAVPELDPKWTLLLGDCIHNLRSALDQLVCELVRANGGTPELGTQFPAHAEPGGVRIPGGVAPEALRLIEGVQPYTESDDGNRIRLIDRLDLVHQQRQLPLAPCAGGRRITVNFRQQRVAPQVVKSWTSDRALEPGKTVHGCEYITPYYAEDPNLKVIPHIVVEDPVVTRIYGRTPAPEMVNERLLQWVRAVYLPRFEPFFS